MSDLVERLRREDDPLFGEAADTINHITSSLAQAERERDESAEYRRQRIIQDGRHRSSLRESVAEKMKYLDLWRLETFRADSRTNVLASITSRATAAERARDSALSRATQAESSLTQATAEIAGLREALEDTRDQLDNLLCLVEGEMPSLSDGDINCTRAHEAIGKIDAALSTPSPAAEKLLAFMQAAREAIEAAREEKWGTVAILLSTAASLDTTLSPQGPQE